MRKAAASFSTISPAYETIKHGLDAVPTKRRPVGDPIGRHDIADPKEFIMECGKDLGTLKREAADLASYVMHCHYCSNDIEAVVSLFDEQLSWIGAGEGEYASGKQEVTDIFRSFEGKIPKCNIDDEEYTVLCPAPGVFVCSGRTWISTDSSTGVHIRVHQRLTMVLRHSNGKWTCCHIHASNPYEEMEPNEMGFPEKMARQSQEYLQKFIDDQNRQLAEQRAEVRSIYDTVPCGIMRLARGDDGTCRLLTANHATAVMVGLKDEDISSMDWSDGISSLVMDSDVSVARKAMNDLHKPGDVSEAVYRLVGIGGEIIYINAVNTLIARIDDEDIIQRIMYDITERRNMEEALKEIGYRDALTGLYNRSKFSKRLKVGKYDNVAHLGIAYFDINGLKEMNDKHGHTAGDDLICRTADHIKLRFPSIAYRIGGDEFVVIDALLNEDAFRSKVAEALQAMHDDGISIAVGVSWRDSSCNVSEQFDEADKLMYEDKARHYREKGNDRRHRR